MDLYALSDGCSLHPCSEDDLRLVKMLSRDRAYHVTISEARSIRLHRKYFSLINTAWECIDEEWRNRFRENRDNFRKSITLLAGFTDQYYNPATGEWYETPRSISFERMPESEFRQLYEQTIRVIYQYFLPMGSQRQKTFDEELKGY